MKQVDYLHRRDPWKHQDRIFCESRDEPAWGFFMEQGTGKSKVMVDTAAWNYMRGRVNGVLIVCDKGIVRTWVEEHLPENMPRHIPYRILVFDAARAGTKKAAAERRDWMEFDGLPILITNWAAFRTSAGRDFFERFCLGWDVLMMLDESDAIKTPKAAQTKAITAVGKRTTMRRIATGTPAADGPFDVFAQMRFLDPDILGTGSFTVFKHEYGDWEKRYTATHSYPHLICYRNLEQLHALLDSKSHRVLKEDCFDLPPKVYEPPYYVELGSDAKAMHETLREDLVYIGEPVDNPLVALTRASQIAAGFYVDGNVVQYFAEQPKADAIVTLLNRMGMGRQAVVWGQFQAELAILSERMNDAKIPFISYHGQLHPEDRDEAERVFKAGDVQVILATTQSAAKGRNWQNASAMFYHSNSPKLVLRTQSEDRAHRGGTKHSVTYWDVCAEGTGDYKRLEALKAKKNLAAIVTGDNIREWL